jgi:hypothetical protein
MITETTADPALARLTFDQTVPRAMVDRGDASMVLITSWERSGADGLVAGAVWPRLGGYYTLLDPTLHDPMLVVETVRQAALLLAHVLYDIPLATMQVLRAFGGAIDDASALRVTDAATEVVVRLSTRTSQPTGQPILQTVMTGEIIRNGRRIGEGVGKAIIPPADQYVAMRGRDPGEVSLTPGPLPPAVDPRRVGRVLERDVVVSPSEDPGCYLLRVDPQHPNFFDNPTDHTPGMLLTEAMRQAVIAESGNPYFASLAFDIRFLRFVEIDRPATVHVRRVSGTYSTEIRQGGRVAARGEWLDGAAGG